MKNMHVLCLLTLSFCISGLSSAQPGKDRLGDPLPEGARARLGTDRMRNYNNSAVNFTPDGKNLLATVEGKLVRVDYSTGKVVGPFTANRPVPLCFSADGKRAITSNYQSLDVWDVSNGNPLCEIKHSSYFGSNNRGELSFSADGKRLALSGRVNDKDKNAGVKVTVWDIDLKKEIASIRIAQNQAGYVCLSKDGKTLVTWGSHYEEYKPGTTTDQEKDPTRLLQIWNVDTQTEITSVRTGYGPYSVTLTSDAKYLLTSQGTGTIHFWDTKTGKLSREIFGRSRSGFNLTLSPDDKTLASASIDCAIQLWDVASLKLKSTVSAPIHIDNLGIERIQFLNANEAVAQTYIGSTRLVWEVPSGKAYTPIVGHTEPVNSLAFNKDDSEIYSASQKTILKWSAKTGEQSGPMQLKLPGSGNHLTNSAIGSVHIHPTHPWVFTNQYGDNTGQFDLETLTQKCTLPIVNNPLPLIQFSKDGNTICSLTTEYYTNTPKNAKIQYIRMNSDKKTNVFELPPGKCQHLALNADGTHVALIRGVEEKKDKLKTMLSYFELETGKLLHEVALTQDFYSSWYLAMNPDGKHLVVIQPDGEHTVYELPELKKVRTLKSKREFGRDLTTSPLFSHDGSKFAASYGSRYSSTPSKIVVYDWKSGDVDRTFSGHSQQVNTLCFSHDLKTLATGSVDSTILLWDLTKSQ